MGVVGSEEEEEEEGASIKALGSLFKLTQIHLWYISLFTLITVIRSVSILLTRLFEYSGKMGRQILVWFLSSMNTVCLYSLPYWVSFSLYYNDC